MSQTLGQSSAKFFYSWDKHLKSQGTTTSMSDVESAGANSRFLEIVEEQNEEFAIGEGLSKKLKKELRLMASAN